MRPFLLLAIAATSAWLAELVMPLAFERDAPVPIVYRTSQLATGKGELSIRWTDVNGRVVDDRRLPVDLLDENE
jgi:hypothetical protein